MTSTGEGINILIVCDYMPIHDWMAFSSWYSISKNLPDAKVGLLCNRDNMQFQLFNWVKKCGLKFTFHKKIDKKSQVDLGIKMMSTPLLVLEPDVMVLKELTSDLLKFFEENNKVIGEKVWWIKDEKAEEKPFLEDHIEAKSEKIYTFVSIEEGWGNFVVGRWINRLTTPFVGAESYGTKEMTWSETKIQKLWKNALQLQNALKG